MSTTETVVLCGSCDCAVETVANPESHDKVTCSGCGKSARYDEVIESVRAYVADVAAKHMAKAVANAARRSKFIKADIKKQPNRSFDWICSDMGL